MSQYLVGATQSSKHPRVTKCACSARAMRNLFVAGNNRSVVFVMPPYRYRAPKLGSSISALASC